MEKTLLKLTVAEIVADPRVNVRVHQLNREKVEEYKENFALLPPISVFLVNNGPAEGKYHLIDGAHRLAAAKDLGIDWLEVEDLGAGDYVTAQDVGGAKNIDNALPLTSEQKKEVARIYRENHPEASDEEVGQYVHVSRTTVMRWFQEEKDQKRNRAQKGSQKAKSKAFVAFTKITRDLDRWKKQHIDPVPVGDLGDKQLEAIVGGLKPMADLYAHLAAELDKREKA